MDVSLTTSCCFAEAYQGPSTETEQEAAMPGGAPAQSPAKRGKREEINLGGDPTSIAVSLYTLKTIREGGAPILQRGVRSTQRRFMTSHETECYYSATPTTIQ